MHRRKETALMSETKEAPNTNEIPDDEALLTIGRAYYTGLGRTADFKQAVRFFRKSADLGNVEAMSLLGNCYLRGQGVKKDKAAALTLFENASEQGDITATFRIGDMYKSGVRQLLEKDPLKAAKFYLDALNLAKDHGDIMDVPEVYLRLADCLLNGIGMEKDVHSAYDFYCSAEDGFRERIESGDRYCMEDLDRAEEGADQCEKILGIKSDTDPKTAA